MDFRSERPRSSGQHVCQLQDGQGVDGTLMSAAQSARRAASALWINAQHRGAKGDGGSGGDANGSVSRMGLVKFFSFRMGLVKLSRMGLVKFFSFPADADQTVR
jgi:hypothetical protein